MGKERAVSEGLEEERKGASEEIRPPSMTEYQLVT